MVRHRRARRRPDRHAHAARSPSSTAWCSSCRSTRRPTSACTTTPPSSSRRTARSSASTARRTSRRSGRASGRSSTSSPGTSGIRCSTRPSGRLGLIICYDRHFPEIGAGVGLKGAQLVFNPSATVESLSKYLWELEQPAHAVANGYWIGAINRVGVEEPLNSAKFYGSSYFCDPRGQIQAKASDDEDEVLVARRRLRREREGAQHVAVPPGPPAGALRRPHGGGRMTSHRDEGVAVPATTRPSCSNATARSSRAGSPCTTTSRSSS